MKVLSRENLHQTSNSSAVLLGTLIVAVWVSGPGINKISDLDSELRLYVKIEMLSLTL